MTQTQWDECADPAKMLTWARRLTYDDAMMLLASTRLEHGHISGSGTKSARDEVIHRIIREFERMRMRCPNPVALAAAQCAVIRACIPLVPTGKP